MAKSRLHHIRLENAHYEKQTPYNHCDRWCERCPGERQARCTLYKDELERKVTVMAHGLDEDDPQILEEVMKWQYEGVDEKIQQFMEEEGIDEEELEEIDLDGHDDPGLSKIKKHIEFAKDNPLKKTTLQYEKRTHEFLLRNYFDSKNPAAELKYDFETISWYHTLLPAKLHRALYGFHEPMAEGDIALYDAVAQFDICSDGITKSIEALRRLKSYCPQEEKLIVELLVLLQNLSNRITALLGSVCR